jgi:V/A-type H+-transporting ATPase subunit I
MKQVTIVAARSDEAATLAALVDVGVVHLVEAPVRDDEAVAVVRARVDAAREAVAVLARVAAERTGAERRAARTPRPAPRPAPPAREIEEVVAEVARLSERLDDLRATHEELEATRVRLAPFGAFDPDAVRRLRDQGVAVRLVRPTHGRELPNVPGAVWMPLGGNRRDRSLALVGRPAVVDAVDLPDEVALPSDDPARLAAEIAGVDRALQATRDRLSELADVRGAVEGWLRHAEETLQVEEARAGMGHVGAVDVLQGFVPVDEVGRLRAVAAAEGWGLWVRDVEDPDAAPTLLRNPRWVRPIGALFEFLGVVPAYGHVDVSVPFLVFFSLFFAMIVGDAGYGVVFLLLTELVVRRMRPAMPRVVALLRLLSIATIAWGLASGSVFGLAVLPSALARLRLEWLTEERNLIGLSFAIGAVHLTLAHAWNAVRFIGSRRALADLGWIATTWTMYFLARQLVLDDPFPAAAWWSFAVGVALIVAFTTPWRLLRREWFQHALLPLTLVNNFVDVVSYVRLFAVGAATFAVAGAFNDLAAGIGLGGLLGDVLAALVLFFGHALNVLLAAMGVLVHGVRLNTLEFAGHLGLPWTGHPYRPLAHTAPVGAEGEP